MDFSSLFSAGARGLPSSGGANQKLADTSETIHISSLALIKMLIHGRKGVPMEVMGLMLGEFIDEYTIDVVDVFAMPQSGTGVSVEAVDPVFQAQMLEMLQQTNRPQPVVGWYHSHPGFGCWLSSVDINTQQSFEQLNPRSVAVVVDPIQSVRGRVVMDAFRLIAPSNSFRPQPSRQITSNLGHLREPSLQALMHNLNRQYYSINCSNKRDELDQAMLLSIHQKGWSTDLSMPDWHKYYQNNIDTLKHLIVLVKEYQTRLEDEDKLSALELIISSAGKRDPKKNIDDTVETLLHDTINHTLTSMIDSIVF